MWQNFRHNAPPTSVPFMPVRIDRSRILFFVAFVLLAAGVGVVLTGAVQRVRINTAVDSDLQQMEARYGVTNFRAPAELEAWKRFRGCYEARAGKAPIARKAWELPSLARYRANRVALIASCEEQLRWLDAANGLPEGTGLYPLLQIIRGERRRP